MAILLLRAGADIRLRENLNVWTALKAACHNGHLGVTQLLLRHMRGEGLDEKDLNDNTALWLASCNGHAEICRALLLAGADHTITDDDGRTPRQIAQQTEGIPCTAVFEVGALST
jgi:ankyrin repeat protein